jgi:uncharacterized protein
MIAMCLRPIALLSVALLAVGGCRDDDEPGRPLALEGGAEGGAVGGELSAGDDTTFFRSDDVELHYALDLPAGTPPFPAVVVGHGSGRSTKLEGVSLARGLRDRGFAVLRYDKRGVGRSGGEFRGVSAASSEEQVGVLAGDMIAGVTFLRARADIDAGRIGLMGVSQAGWIMSAAAARSADVRFFVAVVGSVMPIGKNIFYENQREDDDRDAVYRELAAYDGPLGWDPLPALRARQTPALWLLAEQDRLVPTRACAPVLAGLVGEGHPYVVKRYSGVGHELGGRGDLFWPDVEAWLGESGR